MSDPELLLLNVSRWFLHLRILILTFTGVRLTPMEVREESFEVLTIYPQLLRAMK